MAKFSEKFNYPKHILVTGGLGDFIAIESYFDDDFIDNLETIFYATRMADSIVELVRGCPRYDNVQQVVLTNGPKVFFHKKQVSDYVHHNRIFCDQRIWLRTVDFSILHLFNHCDEFHGSSFADCPMKSNISKFNLPKDYFILCNQSVNFIPNRDFNEHNWNFLFKLIEDYNYYFVVLGKGMIGTRGHKKIINLINQTTMPETVEIMKRAMGYIGIDSALSVLAAKLYEPRQMLIRASNDFTKRYKHIYYSPHTSLPFLGNHFAEIIRDNPLKGRDITIL